MFYGLILLIAACIGQADKKKDSPQLDLDVMQTISRAEELKRITVEKLKKKHAPKSAVAAAESANYLPVPEAPFKIGDLGTAEAFYSVIQMVRVDQVTGDKDFIATLFELPPQVAGLIGRPRSTGSMVWFHGFDTRKLTDGQEFSLATTWRITGTKRYETAVGGTMQITVFEPIDLAPYFAEARTNDAPPDDPAAKAKHAKAAKAAGAAQAAAETPAQKGARAEKAADSKLKLAESLLKAGKPEAYRATLREIADKYPETAAGKLAARRLK